MGCRAHIAIMNEDGTLEYIYIHFEGQMSGVGKVLLTSYNTHDRVRALIAAGSARVLLPDLAAMEHYKNADGSRETYKAKTMEEFAADTRDHRSENMYVFHRYGVWFGRAEMQEVARYEPASICHYMSTEEWRDELENDDAGGITTWVPLTPHLCDVEV